MAIIDIQRRLAEIGRIRLGHQVETSRGKKRPAALGTFRLTSRDRARIEEAAALYGGDVTKWDQSPTGIPQWEVITKTDKLPVIVPPTPMAFSQNYELWSGGGCKRRCDTETEFISGESCLCDILVQQGLQRDCKPTTRLSVMLRDVKGLGVWRVDTTSFYASVEIPGGVGMIEFFAGQGMMLPAILRLDQRTIKRPDEPTKQFVVPVLDVDVTPGQLLGGMTAPAATPELPQRAALTPVPESTAAPVSIADQMAAVGDIPSRRRSQPIKSTGIAPRTMAQRMGRDDPWGAAPPPPDDWEPPNHPHGPEQSRAQYEDAKLASELAEEQQQTEQQGYDAIDAAREAAENTQDQPRMCTHGQLTKLGVLLTNRGFDKSVEGRTGRLELCRAALKQLFPDSPYAGRPLTTSKQLTFDEASGLIDMFEDDERKERARLAEQKPDRSPGEHPNGDSPQDHPQGGDKASTEQEQLSLGR